MHFLHFCISWVVYWMNLHVENLSFGRRNKNINRITVNNAILWKWLFTSLFVIFGFELCTKFQMWEKLKIFFVECSDITMNGFSFNPPEKQCILSILHNDSIICMQNQRQWWILKRLHLRLWTLSNNQQTTKARILSFDCRDIHTSGLIYW